MARRPKPPKDSLGAATPASYDPEKTSVDFQLPDFGELENADPTDKQPVPNLPASEEEALDRADTPRPGRRKLTLPVPGQTDPQSSAKPKSQLPLPKGPPRAIKERAPERPAPAAPAKPKARLSLYAGETSNSNRLVLGVVGFVVLVIGIAFAVAPDGQSEEEIALARERGVPASRMSKTPLGGESFQQKFRRQNPDLVVRSPVARTRRKRVVATPSRPNPPKARARIKVKPTNTAPAETRYGFEDPKVQPVNREYDNYSSNKPKGAGYPLLIVFSRPPGMVVEVDGKLVGVSPLSKRLPDGTTSVKVRLSGSGFQAWESSVQPDETDRFKVGVTMTPSE